MVLNACNYILLLFVLAGINLQNVETSHFRGGIITWKPSSLSPLTVDFNFRLAFRRSYGGYLCDSNTIANRGIIGSGGTWRAQNAQCSFCGQQNVADTGFYCTSVSTQEDWSQGENHFNYTFPYGGIWKISYSDCCWISNLVRGADGGWSLSTTVNLTSRSDTGTINSSPASVSSPIVRLQRGCPQTINIPTEDPDGDLVRCRWAVGSAECNGVCKAFPWGLINEEKCTVSYNGNGQTGWYAVALTLEDFPTTTSYFNNASALSKVGLQFLVHIAQHSGLCSRKPFLTGSSPVDGSCMEIPTDEVYRFTLEAKHLDSSKPIVEILTVSPIGLLVSPLQSYTGPYGDQVYYKNVSWTPSSNQAGQHIFCFKALDVVGIESDQRCVTFLVGSGNTPIPILSSRVPVSPVAHAGPGFVVWRIDFNNMIKKPRHSRFIRIVLLGHEIYRLDTKTSSDVTLMRNSSTLQFRTPSVILSMRGNYSVIIDSGAVVGRGCSSDGPPTPGITSHNKWTFVTGICPEGYYLGRDYYTCVEFDECAAAAGQKLNARHRRSSSATKVAPERQKRALMPAECTSYANLSSLDRSIGYDSWPLPEANLSCDNHLTPDWYRFTDDAGTQMPEKCVHGYRCGGELSGWLTGAHPTLQEGLVTRQVCFSIFGYMHDCCSERQTILVRNCNEFYVYRLNATSRCARFCGTNNSASSQARTTSVPRVPTTSRVIPAECTSYTNLSSMDRAIGYHARRNFSCDDRLRSGWYRFTGDAGTQMPETCVAGYRCGTFFPGWVSGTHPTVKEGRVTRRVCFAQTQWHFSCCLLNQTILVRNCTGFYVYRLNAIMSTCARFCGNNDEVRVYNVTHNATTPSTAPVGHSTWPTSYPGPSAMPYNAFVPRLPANCDQLCVNTRGSYYCSCHQGYVLSADGRTCADEDECKVDNGGCSHKCINVLGSYYCACPDGQTMRSDNKSCHEPGIEVVCTDQYMQINLERRYFRDFDPTYMHLVYKSCVASANSTHITLQTQLNDCGTSHNETDSKIRFMNAVKAELLVIGGVVTRTRDLMLPFYCEYSKHKLLSVSFRPRSVVFASEGRYGNFTFKLNLFKTSIFAQAYQPADYPILVRLNEPLYLQYEVVSPNRTLVVFAENCRATPSPSPYAVPQYVFLRRGCALDSTMRYNYNLNPVQRFSIKAFRFLIDHRTVYLHCELMACHSNTLGSRCARGCQRSRKRRDSSVEKETPETYGSRKYSVGSGPLTVSANNESKGDGLSNATLVAAVSAVAGFFVIVSVVLLTIMAHRRLLKKFQSRNKVVDMSLNTGKDSASMAFVNQDGNTEDVL